MYQVIHLSLEMLDCGTVFHMLTWVMQSVESIIGKACIKNFLWSHLSQILIVIMYAHSILFVHVTNVLHYYMSHQLSWFILDTIVLHIMAFYDIYIEWSSEQSFTSSYFISLPFIFTVRKILIIIYHCICKDRYLLRLLHDLSFWMGFEERSTSVCLCARPLQLSGTAWDPVCTQNTLQYHPLNGREGEPGYSNWNNKLLHL